MELDHQMLHDWLIVIFFYVESVPDSTVHSKGRAGPLFPSTPSWKTRSWWFEHKKVILMVHPVLCFGVWYFGGELWYFGGRRVDRTARKANASAKQWGEPTIWAENRWVILIHMMWMMSGLCFLIGGGTNSPRRYAAQGFLYRNVHLGYGGTDRNLEGERARGDRANSSDCRSANARSLRGHGFDRVNLLGPDTVPWFKMTGFLVRCWCDALEKCGVVRAFVARCWWVALEKWGIRPSRLTILRLCQNKIGSLVRCWWVALETFDIWKMWGVSYEYKPLLFYLWTPNGKIGYNHPLRAGVCWDMSRMDMFLMLAEVVSNMNKSTKSKRGFVPEGYLNPGFKMSMERDSKMCLLCPL